LVLMRICVAKNFTTSADSNLNSISYTVIWIFEVNCYVDDCFITLKEIRVENLAFV
jgi:hypothetical protein